MKCKFTGSLPNKNTPSLSKGKDPEVQVRTYPKPFKPSTPPRQTFVLFLNADTVVIYGIYNPWLKILGTIQYK